MLMKIPLFQLWNLSHTTSQRAERRALLGRGATASVKPGNARRSGSWNLLLLACGLVVFKPCLTDAQPTPDELAKIKAAAPEQATVKPTRPRKLLVFSRSWGYKHTAIPYGKAAAQSLAEKTGAFTVTISDDDAWFEPDKLKQFDAVLFNNSNNEIFLPDPEELKKLPADQQARAQERDAMLKKSFVDFLSAGKGLAVIHAGVASLRQWPEFGKIIGARFDNHPWNEGSTVTLKVTDTAHSITKAFGEAPFVIMDEIYQFKEYRRDQLRVLFGVDVQRTDFNKVKNAIHRTDGDFALGWVKKYGAGRVFYSALGHQHDLYWNSVVLRHYLDGIQFVLGDLKAATEPAVP